MEKTKYCPMCGWGARKTERGYVVYNSNKRFHHYVRKGSADEKIFKKGKCPVHDMKLK